MISNCMIQSQSAVLGEGLALLGSGWSSRNASSVHEVLVGCESPQHIRLGVKGLGVPDSLLESATPYPYFDVVGVLVVELGPEGELSPQHIVSVLVGLEHVCYVLVVEVEPSRIGAVANSQVVSHPHVDVERAVLRYYYRVNISGQASSPPMHHVSLLNSELVHVHPVNELLLWVQLLQHPVLLPPVVQLYLCLPDSTLLDKLCFVGQAGQHHLITSEVDIRVRNNIENFGEDLLDQLVSFVEGPGHTCHQFCLHPVPCF